MNKKIFREYIMKEGALTSEVVEGFRGTFPDCEAVQDALSIKDKCLLHNPTYLNLAAIYGLMDEIDKLKSEIKELKGL